MEILKIQLDSVKTEKAYSFVVKTSNDIEITMYGEILNDEVNKSATNPSFWNDSLFKELNEQEQDKIKSIVNAELLKFT